jgi:hypothetical protein
MSEYQYYEFAAVDRPLSRAEMARLRAVSTRAEISSSRFANHYEWGDLKADPAEWIRRYFDAFVYWANWCHCQLALRVPADTFDKAELKRFAVQRALDIRAGGRHWILTWAIRENEDHERFADDDGSGWMRRLLPLRDELLRGDLRPLYLGWLAGACGGELDEKAREPEVPAGLSQLSVAQQALVEFLAIDPDMLAAAKLGSAPVALADTAEAYRIDTWLETWPREDMLAVLKLIAQGRGQEAERQIRSAHAAWLKKQRPSAVSAATRRSVAALRELSESARPARLAQEAKLRAQQDAKRRRQREAHLRRLMAEVDTHWRTIEAQANHGSASSYERAVKALAELAEGYTLTNARKEFERLLGRFVTRHAKRGALLRRLKEAGLWSG